MPATDARNRADAPVRTIMTPGPATVDPEDSLRAVAEELLTDEIGAVLVVSPGGRPGLISERDLLAHVGGGGDLDGAQAGEVMTTDLVTARPTDTIAAVGALMRDAGVRHVPVRDEDGWQGMVSMRDVLAALLDAVEG